MYYYFKNQNSLFCSGNVEAFNWQPNSSVQVSLLKTGPFFSSLCLARIHKYFLPRQQLNQIFWNILFCSSNTFFHIQTSNKIRCATFGRITDRLEAYSPVRAEPAAPWHKAKCGVMQQDSVFISEKIYWKLLIITFHYFKQIFMSLFIFVWDHEMLKGDKKYEIVFDCRLPRSVFVDPLSIATCTNQINLQLHTCATVSYFILSIKLYR